MKLWLINPFDPLPGEQEQPGRYGRLVEALASAGHQVCWWSCDFSHRFKRRLRAADVQAAASARGFEVRLLPVPEYRANVSAARLWSHYTLGRRFRDAIANEPHPDLILASAPPLETSHEAVRFAHRHNIPSIVDIQDQWPANFASALPSPLRPLHRVLLLPWYSLERDTYRLASAITGVAGGYVRHGLALGGPKDASHVFPLGVDLSQLDRAMRDDGVPSPLAAKKPGQIRITYGGSLTRSYDIATILGAAVMCLESFGDRVSVVLAGSGELAAYAGEEVSRRKLTNVTVLPFQPLPQFAKLLSSSDVGLNSSRPDALIYLPNKLFYYLGASLAVLNSIPGECADLVDGRGCGVSYVAGNAQNCFDAIRTLVEFPDRLAAMRRTARELAQSRFDRPLINADFVAFIEDVAARRASPRPLAEEHHPTLPIQN